MRAFLLDEALAMRLGIERRRQLERLGSRKDERAPEGLRYATAADVTDWATAEDAA